MENKDIILGLTAIICITILETTNILMGHNGAMLTMAVGMIAGIAGFMLPSPQEIKKKILRM